MTMSGTNTAATALIATDADVEVRLPLGAGGTSVWCPLYGASGTSVNAGTRNINEVETYKGTVIQHGELGKPEITFDIGSYLPHMRVMQSIQDLFRRGQSLAVRWSLPRREIEPLSAGADNTIDISTAGVVSFNSGVPTEDIEAFASDLLPEGVALFTGTTPNRNVYIIETKTLNAQGVLTGFVVVDGETMAFPASAVSDQAFGFEIPKVSMPAINCEIMSAGNQDGSSGQAGLSSQLQLRAKRDLPDMRVDAN